LLTILLLLTDFQREFLASLTVLQTNNSSSNLSKSNQIKLGEYLSKSNQIAKPGFIWISAAVLAWSNHFPQSAQSSQPAGVAYGVKRTMVTAIECISANGRSLLPIIIWPATTHQSNWTTFPTPGWHYACSESGYTDSKISLEWLKRVFDRQTKG
jgi:hypothetical protein